MKEGFEDGEDADGEDAQPEKPRAAAMKCTTQEDLDSANEQGAPCQGCHCCH